MFEWLLVGCGIVGFILIVGLLILASLKFVDIIKQIKSNWRS